MYILFVNKPGARNVQMAESLSVASDGVVGSRSWDPCIRYKKAKETQLQFYCPVW